MKRKGEISKESYYAGVTPEELHLRQTGKCFIVVKVIDNVPKTFCSDGNELAPTDCLMNPTIECSRCMAKFVEKVISDTVLKGNDEQ